MMVVASGVYSDSSNSSDTTPGMGCGSDSDNGSFSCPQDSWHDRSSYNPDRNDDIHGWRDRDRGS